jgi:hypothetical protein
VLKIIEESTVAPDFVFTVWHRYISIVHGGQAAIDAAVLKLFPDWTDNVSVSIQSASECRPTLDHAAPSSVSADSSSALSVHDDLDEYLLQMDEDSIAGSGFSLVDGRDTHNKFVSSNCVTDICNRVSKDSSSFDSATESIESYVAVQSEESRSNLDQLSVTATRLRLLKRVPQVAAFFAAGEVSCSDLDAG